MTANYVHQQGYLELEEGLIDSQDNSKQVHFAFSLLPPLSTTIINFPPASTTLVGTDTSQILTNKTIIDNTNNVSANSLKTTGSPVQVASALPPSTGQSLFATNSTTASWQTPLLTYLFKNGAMTIPSLPTLKQWYGYVNTSTQAATFNVTTTGLAGGPTIFADLTNAHFQTSARFNTTTLVDVPFVSIRSATNATGVVLVNVLAPTSILLLGATTMKANVQNVTVYLHVIGT